MGKLFKAILNIKLIFVVHYSAEIRKFRKPFLTPIL